MNRGGPPGPGRVPPPNLGNGPPPNLGYGPPPNLGSGPPPNLGHGPPPNLGYGPPPNLGYGPPGGNASQGGCYTPQISGPVVKMFTESDSRFNLGVRGDYVTVVHANDSDPCQQWIKDESWGNRYKESGLPAYALVNTASGKALAHPRREDEKVYLTQYHPNAPDVNVLWTSADADKGFNYIRSFTEGHLTLAIIQQNCGVKEGQAVIIHPFLYSGRNQHWKLEPICTSRGRN